MRECMARGGVAERTKAAVSKTVGPVFPVPWVQIPPPPPESHRSTPVRSRTDRAPQGRLVERILWAVGLLLESGFRLVARCFRPSPEWRSRPRLACRWKRFKSHLLRCDNPHWRDGRADEGGSLENCWAPCGVPWVRIPLPPREHLTVRARFGLEPIDLTDVGRCCCVCPAARGWIVVEGASIANRCSFGKTVQNPTPSARRLTMGVARRGGRVDEGARLLSE